MEGEILEIQERLETITAVSYTHLAELGIDEVYSELLPGDKVAKVEELLARKGSKEKLHR